MAKTLRLEILEGKQFQSIYESITYRVNTTPWGGAPASPSAIGLKRNLATNAWEDVTSTIFPAGAASLDGDYVVLPRLTALVNGGQYLIIVTWQTSGGDTLATHAFLDGKFV